MAAPPPSHTLEPRAALTRVALAGVVTAGSSAFFWLPAIGERDHVQLEWLQFGSDYRDYFLRPEGHSFNQDKPENRGTRSGVVDTHLHYPHQLFSPPMVSLAQAGLVLIATAGITVAIARRCPAGPTLPLLLAALVCWFLTLSPSAPLWRLVPVLPLLQFPSRLLGPAAVCLSLAARCVVLARGGHWSGASASPAAWPLPRTGRRGGRYVSLQQPGRAPAARCGGRVARRRR